MSVEQIKATQQELMEAGYYDGQIDGIWGPKSEAALERFFEDNHKRAVHNLSPVFITTGGPTIAWGAKVSPMFRERVLWTAQALDMPPYGADWLMACMAWETGETFSPSIANGAGSGAVGLIQFMPNTAVRLGTSTRDLERMSAEDQLNFVYKYFLPYKGRLMELSDVYMAILWPLAIGKALDHVLWTRERQPLTYRQNIGIDIDRNGAATKEEATAKVEAKLRKGRQPGFLG